MFFILGSFSFFHFCFFFQAEDGIRDRNVTGVQTCALPILSSVADLNILDPGSRFNQKNRGRFVTEVYDGVEATSQANLDAWAERKLDDLVNASNKVEIEHVFMPDLMMNETILFRAGDVEMTGAVTNTEFDLDPQAMVKTKLRSVLSGEEPDEEEGADDS